MVDEEGIGNIGAALVREGLITNKELSLGLERQKQHGGRLGTNLVALGFIGEEALQSFFKKAPITPKTIEDTGLPQSLINELILKTVLNMHDFTIPEVAERLKLPISIIDSGIQILRRDRMIEVRGSSEYARTSYQHNLASEGRARAYELLEVCHYIGPAPVTLDDYRKVILNQTVKNFEVREDDIKKALSSMVLNEEFLKRIGPALSSGKSIFLYGPAGNGKSTIARKVGSVFKEKVYIPYALYVGGQIITIYNAVNHQAAEDENETRNSNVDKRWVLIKRPIVMVGGELNLKMLELNFSSVSKFYDAPLQMKANNGLLVIDDFGRQLIRPQDLLNRWIVPLDRRSDYMTLHTGLSFSVPFDQLIIFCTNIEPKELVDEAFLRRMRYKVNVDYPSVDEYKKIFSNICKLNSITFKEDVFQYLLEKYKKTGLNLCACHPEDLIDQIIDMAHYYETPPVLSKDSIELAWNNFLEL
jgi:MoxR-like ATPase